MSPAPVTGAGVAATGRGTMSVLSVDGVAVRVSASCLLVVALLAVAFEPRALDVAPGLGAWAYAYGVLVGVLVYAAALLHEAAHALAARWHGREVESVTLSVAGGRTVVLGEARTPQEELVTAAAGPLASLALGVAALGAGVLAGDGLVGLVLDALVLANLVIGVLDLLPAPPLDGGRVVRAVAWSALGSQRRGVVTAAWCGRVVALLVLGAPLLREPLLGSRAGPLDAAIAVALAALLWLAAGRELARVAPREVDRGP